MDNKSQEVGAQSGGRGSRGLYLGREQKESLDIKLRLHRKGNCAQEQWHTLYTRTTALGKF